MHKGAEMAHIQGVRTWTGLFHNVPVTTLEGILRCNDGFYMTKGSQFWYLCLLLILKVIKNSIFKGGTLRIKKITKNFGFLFNFLFLYIPLLDKYKLFFYKSTQKIDLLGRKMKKNIQFFSHFFPWSKWPQYENFW